MTMCFRVLYPVTLLRRPLRRQVPSFEDSGPVFGCLGYTEPKFTTVTSSKVVSKSQDSTALPPAATKARAERGEWIPLAFSFPVMCGFLLAAVVFGFSVKQFAEPDIWWHLRDGAFIWQHHSFPGVDTFSFGAAGSPWLDHEWLSEMPFFLAFRMFGLPGILFVYFSVLILIYIGVYYRSCTAGADCKDASLATVVAILLGAVSIGPRVLLFGWLCMMGLLVVLDRFQRTSKGLWILPPLFALWINLHASWVFGLVVLGIVIVAGLVKGEWGLVVAQRWPPRELKSLLLASLASLAALFVNPFGYRLVFYPFDFLFHQQSNVQYVEEWQPVDLSTGNGKVALLLIFTLLAAAWFSRRQWRLQDVLLIAFALWAGLSHARFLFFIGIIVVPILAPYLPLFAPYDRDLDKPWLNAAIMVGVFASLLFFFPSSAKLQEQVDQFFPTSALQFMKGRNIQGRIFNQYVWGGFMEWEAPDLQTFIDGRADIFVYNGTLDDHRRATTIEAPFAVFDKYGIEYTLLQTNRPLTYLLEQSPTWHAIYKDNIAEIFQRAH